MTFTVSPFTTIFQKVVAGSACPLDERRTGTGIKGQDASSRAPSSQYPGHQGHDGLRHSLFHPCSPHSSLLRGPRPPQSHQEGCEALRWNTPCSPPRRCFPYGGRRIFKSPVSCYQPVGHYQRFRVLSEYQGFADPHGPPRCRDYPKES